MIEVATPPAAAPSPVVEPGQLDEGMRDALREAKGVLAGGWCQGDYSDGNGNHCAAGAVNAVLFPEGRAWSSGDLHVARHLEAFFDHLLGDGFGSLSRWNDAPGRTQAEVIALFDKALGA
jgi:hypothetical protein